MGMYRNLLTQHFIVQIHRIEVEVIAIPKSLAWIIELLDSVAMLFLCVLIWQPSVYYFLP